MSRAYDPPRKTASTTLSSPTDVFIGVTVSRKHPVSVYSGLLADSVVPDGLTTMVEATPKRVFKYVSTSVVP